MGTSRLKQELGNHRLLRWLLSFLALEGAIGLGALAGVALLNTEWVGGLGVFNLQLFMILGLIPVFFTSIHISRRDALTTRRRTFVLGLASFLASMALSWWFAVAMVGI